MRHITAPVVLLVNLTLWAQTPFCPNDTFTVMPTISNHSNDLAVLQGKVYGCRSWFGDSQLTEYDPSTGVTSVISNPSFQLGEFSLTAHGDKLYVFGGYNGSSPSAQAWSYEIGTSTWASLPDMPMAITQTSAVTMDDDIYIIGGSLGITQQFFLRYNIADNNYSTLTAPAAYNNSKLLTYGAQVYCFGGHRYNGNTMETSNLFMVYEATTDNWQQLPNLPFARSKVAATIWGEHLYVFGGTTVFGGANAQYTTEHEYFAFDLSNSTWTVASDTTTMDPGACAAIGDTVYFSTAQKYYCSNSNGACISAIPVSFTGLSSSYLTTDAPVALVGEPSGGVFIGPGISGTMFTPAVAGEGTHSIIYTYVDGDQCVNSAGLCTSISVGMGLEPAAEAHGAVRIFPNPSHGQFTVELELTGLVSLQTFDTRGRQVHSEVFQAGGAKTVRNLDLSALAKGGYTVQVRNAGAVVTQQLVVE